ncbi:MarR family winged helix-turn-helix transcriptional regulator [Lachnoclostridium edouardi]|uniref:MarR family winged helix-turn-helix transcriptional regulator n=1 Tax=Lachnoclostridium edouardi TaxID=1926283 RepID=UPI000C79F83E|nr:MarR family winged helix-turn-helix transcriptional regulator [Lachnoclostridium edouardi]
MDNNVIKRIREFNRYYTVWLDVMNKGYLGTDLSWPEARILFDIYICPGISATDLCQHLNMDKSYISRILSKFEKCEFLIRETLPGSKGLKKIWLTETGKKEAERIDQNGDKQIIDKLRTLDEETCAKLCEAMVFIENTLRGDIGKE